jgi:hypothetical protein
MDLEKELTARDVALKVCEWIFVKGKNGRKVLCEQMKTIPSSRNASFVVTFGMCSANRGCTSALLHRRPRLVVVPFGSMTRWRGGDQWR